MVLESLGILVEGQKIIVGQQFIFLHFPEFAQAEVIENFIAGVFAGSLVHLGEERFPCGFKMVWPGSDVDKAKFGKSSKKGAIGQQMSFETVDAPESRINECESHH